MKEVSLVFRNRCKPPSTILEEDASDMVPAQNPMDNPTYQVRYLGEVFVGSTGGVDKIEDGVSSIVYIQYGLVQRRV